MEIVNKYFILLSVVFVFLSIFIAFFTCVKFFDTERFNSVKEFYTIYAKYDVDKSLVFEGEND